MIHTKNYYKEKFGDYCAWEKLTYLKAGGIEDNFEHRYEDLSPDEIVGYYIEFYGDNARTEWEYNLQFVERPTKTDDEVTQILAKLYT